MFLGRDVAEDDGLVADLVAEPPHAHGKMPVARRDNRVARHPHAGLVVLIDDHGGRGSTENLSHHTGQPQRGLGGLDCGEVLGLGGAKTDDGGMDRPTCSVDTIVVYM